MGLEFLATPTSVLEAAVTVVAAVRPPSPLLVAVAGDSGRGERPAGRENVERSLDQPAMEMGATAESPPLALPALTAHLSRFEGVVPQVLFPIAPATMVNVVAGR